MKIRVVVGDIELHLDGLDLTKRQVVDLLREAAGVAALLTVPESDDPKPALGFTAHLDLDPERNLGEDLSEWFEESP